jgi:alkanesulfonate monooxygenase SsuD/methylene tetrahydromethanopterin reductase-like flavin-dependent oxidoreductase (luciferase family)
MLSKGRATLGIGAGDSAVRTTGLLPAKMVQLRTSIEFIRGLLSGQEVDVLRPAGTTAEKTWGQISRVRLHGAETWGNVQIEIAVMSPKAATMVGEVAEGVIVDGYMGGNAEGTAATIAAASEGAAASGKAQNDSLYCGY